MVTHLSREANKKCLDLYSKSSDKREESVRVQLVHDPVIPARYLCRQCGYTSTMAHAKPNMVTHLSRAANKKCLDLYSESSDTREMHWVRLAHER